MFYMKCLSKCPYSKKPTKNMKNFIDVVRFFKKNLHVESQFA